MTHPPIEEVKEVISEVIEEIQHGNLVTDHQVRPLLKAAEAYCEMQWMDISTAPQGSWIFGINKQGFIEKICWLSTTANGGVWIDAHRIQFFPTHWMPSPQPPKENQE